MVLFALVDHALMAGAYALSYLDAQSAGGIDTDIWRGTDALFCVGVLYLFTASGAYRVMALANMSAQITKLLVISLGMLTFEWAGLVLLDLVSYFRWPLHGPLTLVGGAVFAMVLVRAGGALVLGELSRRQRLVRTVAVIGGGSQGARLLALLKHQGEGGVRVLGVFDDRMDRARDVVEPAGTLDDLIALSRHQAIDDILIALPWGAEQRLLEVLDKLKPIPANIRLAPDAIGYHFLNSGFERFEGVPVYNIVGRPMGEWGALLKRAEDLVLGSVALVLLAPVMALCALAIRLESQGPILFKQQRYGYNNALIDVYKFRSMYHEARDESASRLATQNDPRITRVGRLLRRTSLDELPQLLNVLNGSMSLVGPRPHATRAKAGGRLYQEVVREYAVRHKVKPGMTGWAQVKGWRGETDTEEKILRRVECDLYYMEHWSIMFDIEIMFRTVFVLTGKNVY
ncbi:undecaprenyl-phosphate glucose phosphotransferase [Pararhodospirillum oryzae]|uniref:Undecaprenyl-phosphate glucose phosphotransferase n=1 Tax=Pararhodospirillum oryzae TaxID=478448 RepID=A0A512H3U3_9PROT|nr:undecaprenyl-phosphate glucose phosphotransferase [Pararhodospirillum oryzae]GEO80139.1 undecaprenyl-phosphate glucose phosphotransferase [Pararhodospirillum oryzae]